MSAGTFLAWLLLRIRQPKITLGEAAELLGGEDYPAKMSAVWDLWGYQPTKKDESLPGERRGEIAPSTGGEFSIGLREGAAASD